MSSQGVQVSATKAKYMEALRRINGSASPQAMEALYVRIKREVIVVFDSQMKNNRAKLKPEHANAQPPYASHQYSVTAQCTAIASVVNNAAADTRPWYNAGQTAGGDNWIVKWMLHQICRYRDKRNQRARSTNFHDDDDLESQGAGAQAIATQSTGFYDAARNSYR